MKIDNIKVYDLFESTKASKYPMAINTEDCTSELTPTVQKLAQSPKGEGHDQWLAGVRVSFDLTFSNKAWVELQRYKFIDFVSSQSTMHRITKFDLDKAYNEYVDPRIIEIMKDKVNQYNRLSVIRACNEDLDKLFLQILYSNPAGFELTARLSTNYRQLKTIYSQRKSHKLPEWRKFCEWIETLPYAKELICS